MLIMDKKAFILLFSYLWNVSDDESIPDIEDVDSMSDSDEADIGTHSNYDEEDIKYRFKDYGNPDKLVMKWRNQIIKFAVTGPSYTGKSTFLNLIRDVYPNDRGKFAKVGHGNCTMFPTEYKHPRNEHITFTDLPGFGTDKVKKKKVFRKYWLE